MRTLVLLTTCLAGENREVQLHQRAGKIRGLTILRCSDLALLTLRPYKSFLKLKLTWVHVMIITRFNCSIPLIGPLPLSYTLNPEDPYSRGRRQSPSRPEPQTIALGSQCRDRWSAPAVASLPETACKDLGSCEGDHWAGRILTLPQVSLEPYVGMSGLAHTPGPTAT